MSLIIFFAWFLLIIGIVAAASLVIFTEYGRDVKIPFSVLVTIIAAFSLGFSIHLFLIGSNL
jgi:hypothetical protein